MYKEFLKNVNNEKKFKLLSSPNTIVYDNNGKWKSVNTNDYDRLGNLKNPNLYSNQREKEEITKGIQQSLNKLGDYGEFGKPLKEDGVFGLKTQAAYDNFWQKNYPSQTNYLKDLNQYPPSFNNSISGKYINDSINSRQNNGTNGMVLNSGNANEKSTANKTKLEMWPDYSPTKEQVADAFKKLANNPKKVTLGGLNAAVKGVQGVTKDIPIVFGSGLQGSVNVGPIEFNGSAGYLVDLDGTIAFVAEGGAGLDAKSDNLNVSGSKYNTIAKANNIDELKGATAHIGAKINLPTKIPFFGQASIDFNPNLSIFDSPIGLTTSGGVMYPRPDEIIESATFSGGGVIEPLAKRINIYDEWDKFYEREMKRLE